MELAAIDWLIIVTFFAISLAIGLYVMRSAGKSSQDFFLSGRNMPWWLLGVSMVATTFAADTPNLITQFIREDGIYANWKWICYLLTGMLTVFFYARLWRKSGVSTDLEFYEVRYKGKLAAFLRGFRAIYLGVIFNVVVMATVSVAAIKISGVLLGFSPVETVLIASVITIAYASLGGLKGILLTDFFQFFVAMAGSIGSCYYLINQPEIGGLSALFEHEQVRGHLDLLPDFSNTSVAMSFFIIPLAVQWWSTWYPGAEPGGGGYIAQRMLSAKNEKHATGATLFFNLAHYALRPWPWILIALASLIVFPNLASLHEEFPGISEQILKDDMAYPAMLTLLPVGLLGIVVASLIAAYMSTLSTHLNWGSSYLVKDVYKRFINEKATEKQQVIAGRLTTIALMVLAALLALTMEDAVEGFNIILNVGAGTGLIFILRWFWQKINPYTEIVGMFLSFIVALLFHFIPHDLSDNTVLLLSLLISTSGWLLATFIAPTTDEATWQNFKARVFPQGYRKTAQFSFIGMITGTAGIYAALFALGYFLMGHTTFFVINLCIVLFSIVVVRNIWNKIH